MDRKRGPVATMFQSMVNQGQLSPVEHMEDLRLPGEYISVPSILTYATPEAPIQAGVHKDAELGQRPEGERSP